MNDCIESLLKEKYLVKGSFEHRKTELIKIFPFITSPIKSTDIRELDTYTGICGEVSRKISSMKRPVKFSSNELKEALIEKVETDKYDTLLDILMSIAFDNEMIVPFSIGAYPYLYFEKDRKVLRDISTFFYEVLWGGVPKQTIKFDFLKNKNDNILHSLLHECLPALENDAQRNSFEFTKLDVGIDGVFYKDWQFLASHIESLKTFFPLFIKLYGLIYLLRTVETLNNQYNDKSLDPIYFTLEWESCSKGRVAYQRGWKRLEGQVRQIFSHAHTLELLNYINLPGLETPFTYLDLKYWCDNASISNKEIAVESIRKLISFYRNSVEPKSGWETFEPFDFKKNDCEVLNEAILFFRMVDCQFRNSQREKPANQYAKWLYQCTVSNFCRIRGRIGRTLAFSKEQLLLLTRLAVGDREKLRLHEYWGELEKRGIAFDFESRRKIVEFFEQLNLLEKKSDSGDAQYVRAII